MDKKADYQDVYDILPFEGEKEIHESCFLEKMYHPEGVEQYLPLATQITELAIFILECKYAAKTFCQLSVARRPRQRIMRARREVGREGIGGRGQLLAGRKKSEVRGRRSEDSPL